MKNFEEIDLIKQLQRALTDQNYITPTPIQAKTIPAALKGRDVLGCAQTGTGKTAAFALPILNQLGKQNRKATPNFPLALILAPTRELAIQIGESFETYGQHMKIRQALVYGGVNQARQVQSLKRGAHVLVATPGRLLDLMNQGHIKLGELELFVLDEADRMLDMGFLPDLKRIIKQLPRNRQSMFFSATMPPKITQLSQTLLRDPISVNVTPKSKSVKRIEQRVLFVSRKEKQDSLRKILTGSNVDRAIVFTRTKRGANMVTQRLSRNGIEAAAIHGNKSQNARQRALDAFKNNQIQVLVATDVAARGIDIDGVTHVINFDVPVEPESYVHRIGRTGRAGADGIALTFCSRDEEHDLRAIEKLIGMKIPVARLKIKSGGQGAKPRVGNEGNRNTTNESKTRYSHSNKPGRKKATPAKSGPKKPRSANQPRSGSNSSNNAKGTNRPNRRRKSKNSRNRVKQTS